MNKSQEDYLRDRIKELEEKIDQLRFSRRVLMNLVERLEKEKWEDITQLEKKNKQLQSEKFRYIKSLWHKNRQIIELETKLEIKKVKGNN